MTNRVTISVDVVSDVVCPWCYIGKKRLESAVAALPEIDVEIRWRPYQLDPSIPRGGMDRRAYMVGKFGSEERVRQMHASIMPLGEAEGIHFAFEDIKVAANTLDAHRVIRWAGGQGAGVQNVLVARLFAMNFEEGRDIGDHATLVEAAAGAGMDVAVVRSLLPSDADVVAVEGEIATASRMGIRGVPCFLIEGKYAVMGAQDVSALADALSQVAAAKARGEFETAG
ncbi:MAG: DsbA family oxidoreductase [Rhizobiaceae bacterium]